ncbi:MAG: efflux RND transporter permease subunit [Bacteroidales bacterium]|nr:efflux RND transporter permease subunit [Bacteroidales bacterium]
MKRLITIFIKYPFYANLVIAIFAVGGLISFLGLKKSFFPESIPRTITVSVVYPGASPKEMEEGVTTRIEEAIRSVVGIKEINSTSSESFASVVITTTGEYDIDITLQEVKNAVDGISSMPVDAERPIVFKQRSITQAVFMALTGEGEVDLQTLKQYAMEIEDDLRASGLITQVAITGYPALEMSVEVTEETLLRYNLTFDEISRAIAQNNLDISAGEIKSASEEILIRSRNRSVDPLQVGDIVVRANPNGSFVRVNDIASVKLKFADVSNRSFLNGNRPLVSPLARYPKKTFKKYLPSVTRMPKNSMLRTRG